MRHPRILLRLALLGSFLLSAGLGRPVQAKDDWLPIPPEELALKDNPVSPGSPAMILYREMFTDDLNAFEKHYFRIKVFTEEGKKQADVEIPYFKGPFRVDDIKARTIRPGGSVVPFEGKAFDKVLVKYRWLKYNAKVFTLPEVQVGSIIEYQYKLRWNTMWLYNTRWSLNRNLFTRRAHFSLRPNGGMSLAWIAVRVPGNQTPQEKDGLLRMELQNIPALPEEDYAPPEEELTMRVSFFYTRRQLEPPEEFWKREGKEWHRYVDDFIGKRKGIERAVAEMVAPDDAPEEKLRKIYARVLQIRNLSYERTKTEKEVKREKLKDNNNVEDVLANGYGGRWEINRLFVALARAAGFQADVVRIARRDDVFFNFNLLDDGQLNSEVALVRLGNEDRYFDPGTRFCPFGLLSWERTGVKGIRLDKEGGVFVTTTQPVSAGAVQERTAALRLDEEGNLEGTVTVLFAGQEALRRRLDALDEDDAGRKKSIEDEVKGWFPPAAQVEITRIDGWEGTAEPLTVEFTLHVPEFAVPTGRRLLLPLGVFQSQQQHPFQHAQRTHPIYFRHPYQQVDRVTIELPEGYRVESLPAPRDKSADMGRYRIAGQNQPGQVQVERLLVMSGYYFDKAYYSLLRSFYDEVKKGDESQAVLEAGEVGGAK